jgi:hypothetical protein
MGRRILTVVLLLILAIFAYVGYNSYDAKRAEANGDVFSRDASDSPSLKAKPDTENTANSESKAQPQQTVVNPAATPPQPTSDTTAPPDANPGPPAASAIDTISPNPPNGMVFSGTGHYQLYRQGNLTWRVNTDTGQTCILFATDVEWKKPRVYRNGCKNR